jgi:hypothetical protein
VLKPSYGPATPKLNLLWKGLVLGVFVDRGAGQSCPLHNFIDTHNPQIVSH